MSKYILILLISTVTLISVDAALPNWIRACKKNDPQISQCISNTVNSLREKLVEGDSSIQLAPIDPLKIKNLDINFDKELTIRAHDLLLTGGKDFKLESFVADIDNDLYKYKISVPVITTKGNYEVDAVIASIPLKGKGPMTLVGRMVTAEGTLHGKKTKRSGKTWYWFPSMDLKVNLGDYEVKLENLFDGEPTIGEATNKLLNEEKSEVLKIMLPGLEKALTEHILNAANNICKHFTYEEMFPES